MKRKLLSMDFLFIPKVTNLKVNLVLIDLSERSIEFPLINYLWLLGEYILLR